MTEQEWLACADPTPMLEFLRGKASYRKLRLFACACCRRIWHLVKDEPNRIAVEIAERYANGDATEEDRRLADKSIVSADRDGAEPDSEDKDAWAAYEAQTAVWQSLALPPLAAAMEAAPSAATAVADSVGSDDAWKSAQAAELAEQAGLLRDIFGNPFHPITIDQAWLTPNATALAQVIHHDRAFDRMPELADTLEEAGCTNTDILDHCRQPGPHVRGCWAVDFLLGKR